MSAEADARHAMVGEDANRFGVEVGRICFYAEFVFVGRLSQAVMSCGQRMPAEHGGQQPLKLWSLQLRRRAATEEQRINLARLAQRGQLALDRRQKRLDEIIPPGNDSEVAIPATMRQKGTWM